MPIIRSYQPKDRERVQAVCKATGPSATPQEVKHLLTTYCNYYIEQEPQNCFVAADEQDEAVGYILCAANYQQYYRTFRKQYMPLVKGLPFTSRMECWGSAFLPRFWAKRYPAHLHIDIFPDYQRMGLGTKLMDALTAHLRAQGVRGVMLVVGKNNVKGRNFYQKYGFREVVVQPFGVVMGLDLTNA